MNSLEVQILGTSARKQSIHSKEDAALLEGPNILTCGLVRRSHGHAMTIGWKTIKVFLPSCEKVRIVFTG